MGLFKRKKKRDVAPTPTVAGVPDEVVATEDFDIVVRQLIRQMTPSETEVVETGHDSIKVGTGEIFLGNLRKGWDQREPGEREIALRNALHGMLLSELRDTSSLDLSMLRPGIRSEWYLNAPVLMTSAQRGGGLVSHGLAKRALGPGLARVLLWDTPTTMGTISEAQISEWGADFDSLWDVAVDNLSKDPAAEGWGRANECAWMPVHTDDYTAERLFIDGFLDPTGIVGDVVMFHPNRQTLIIVDPDDAAGLELGAKLALSRAKDANPVTLMPYVGRGYSWQPLKLPADHRASQAVAELRVGELSSTYSQQKELLATIHGEDLFVATYMVYKIDDQIASIASWTESVIALLPRADMISFTYGIDDPEPATFMVSWEDAHSIIGGYLEPTNHWPERWRVSSFPSPTEIQQLQAFAK